MDDDIRIRRVRPDDGPALEQLYAGISDASRRLRFHGRPGRVGSRTVTAFIAGSARGDGFVATRGDRIVGHLMLEPRGGGIDELAVVVDDRVQHRGVGSLLIAAALASARLRAVPTLVAWVLAENRVARRLLEGSHHRTRRFWEGHVVRYEIDVPLTPPA